MIRQRGKIIAIFEPRQGVVHPKLRTGKPADKVSYFGHLVTYALPFITGKRIENELDQYVEGE